jgi:hypothetical protein
MARVAQPEHDGVRAHDRLQHAPVAVGKQAVCNGVDGRPELVVSEIQTGSINVGTDVSVAFNGRRRRHGA